jgi:hypothetical protein
MARARSTHCESPLRAGTTIRSFRRLSVRANHRFQFHKRSQLFLRSHNQTLSVAAMCVSNEDCYGSENATRKMLCILKSMRHLAPLTLEGLSSTML